MTATMQNIIHIPYDIDVNFNKALSEYVFEALTRNSKKIAQVDTRTGKTETFGQLLERSLDLARSLKGKGVSTNDMIAIYCYNNMDYIAVIAACIFTGTRCCALDVAAPLVLTTHCLKLTAPVLIFCEQESEVKLKSCIKEAGVKSEVITFDKTNEFITMEDFIDKFRISEEFQIDTSRKMRDSGFVCFTSGTTGTPKAAELRNFGLFYGARNCLRMCSESEKIMNFNTPYWITNISMCMESLLYGIQRVIYKKYDLQSIVKVIQDFKVNIALITQHVMNDLIKNPQFFSQYDISCLKTLLIGGSNIGANQFAKLQKLLPHTKFLNIYGTTEIAGVLLMAKTELTVDKSGNVSIGSPLPGFYYKVTDTQNGENLGSYKRGELRCKSDGFFNGYLNQPETTREALDEEGYFKTGDEVYYDDSHNFFYVDRLKEIFKFQGFHVSPTIIEDTLLLHPDVEECAVIPVPHEHDGNWPLAVVILMENSKVGEQDLIKFIEERLADLYHLRAGVRFTDAIPKTSSGKIRRNELRDIIVSGKK